VVRRRALLTGSVATLATLPATARAQWVDCGGLVPAMVAGPCVPTADLDLTFMAPGSLDQRITFTRASTGTYFDAAGVMQTAVTNAPRWDYDAATRALKGLLIEEARTNALLRSSDLSVAPWAVAGALGATAPVVTGNNAVAPDGTTTAARIVLPAVSAGGISQVSQNIATVVDSVFSIYLRGAVGGEQTHLISLGASAYTSLRVTLTTSWQRFSLFVPARAGGIYCVVGTDLRDGTETATPAGTIYAWGAQSEAGAFATSYIPTTSAAVTRAVDAASMLTTGWINPLAGTLLVESSSPESPAVGANREFVGIGTDSSNIIRLAMTNTVGYLSSNVFTANVSRGGASDNRVWPAGVFFKCAITYNTTGLALSLTSGGTAPGTAVATALPASFTTLWIGGSGRGGTASAPYRRVAYWNRVLPNAELQSLTS
jgi:hypothetical protein